MTSWTFCISLDQMMGGRMQLLVLLIAAYYLFTSFRNLGAPSFLVSNASTRLSVKFCTSSTNPSIKSKGVFSKRVWLGSVTVSMRSLVLLTRFSVAF